MKKKRNLTLIIGAVLTAFMLLFLLIGFFYTPYDPDAMNGAAKFAAPSLSHPFGCDHFGRDIFSRVLKGTGTTFFVAFATLLLGGTIGVLVGAFTGYFGGWIDEILMRINDVIVSFPGILLALVFIALLGPGKYNVILALGIIFVHILPNTVPSLLSMAAIGFNNAVLSEAGMSFLGIGVQPPDASLGRMLSESQTYLMTAPWGSVFPGLAVILLALGVSLLGDGLQKKGGN